MLSLSCKGPLPASSCCPGCPLFRTHSKYELYSKPPHSSQNFRLRTAYLRLYALDPNGEVALSVDGIASFEHEDVPSLQEDIWPREDTSSHLNDQMLAALESRNTDEAWRIYDLLMRKRDIPSSVCLSRLVAQLSYAGTPSNLTKAQKLVASLQKRKNASLLDCNCLGLLAMATSKAGAVRYSASVIRLMLKLGYLPHVKAWSAVVSKLGREDVPLALSLFEDICSLVQKGEFPADFNQDKYGGSERIVNVAFFARPDTGAFNAALNACANACLVEKANTIFDQLSEFNLQPDVLTFNIMIKLYALSNNKLKLSKVLMEMETAGVKPCLSTMNSLVAAYVGLDELERAVMLVEALRNGGEDINRILTSDMALLNASKIISTPSIATEGSVHIDSPPVAVELTKDSSPSKGAFFPKFKPNTRTYTIIMKGYMQKGRLNEVKQLLVAMQSQDDTGSLPDEVTYTTVITTCVRLGLLDEALSVLREMVTHKVPANVVTYNVLLKGYCEARQVTKARLLLEDMRIAGVQPDVISFNTLIDGYINNEDSASALEMFTEMREAGIAPSKVSYTSLIKAFGKNGQPNLAEKVFQEMQQDRRVKVDTIAWNALIEAYSKAGHADGAKGAFQRMKDSGHVPTVATYGSLVKGFTLGSNVGEALLLWKEIQERLELKGGSAVPLKPDAGLLDGLVDVCVRAGFFLKALEIVACMEKHQIPADKIKYQRMFVELHSKLYISPYTSQARKDRTEDRRRAVEAFKFWVGLPNTYYGPDWTS